MEPVGDLAQTYKDFFGFLFIYFHTVFQGPDHGGIHCFLDHTTLWVIANLEHCSVIHIFVMGTFVFRSLIINRNKDTPSLVPPHI